MFQNLADKYSKYLLIIGMALTTYVAYVFSFRHAFEAIKLNNQLNVEKNEDQSLAVSYPQIEDQNQFYITALKAYHVKKEDRENRLWQAISGIAVNKGVAIGFVPSTPAIVDTVVVQKGMVAQQFTLKGNYFNIVKSLDSIGRTTGIGRVAEFRLAVDKSSGSAPTSEQLTLQLLMVALAK